MFSQGTRKNYDTDSMKTQDIYNQYQLMPSLQLHQLRVAALASIFCDNLKHESLTSINKSDVVTACLLHDMGNIIKSDFSHFPEFLEPEGKEHWQRIKSTFIETYGPDEHQATIKIAEQIGVSNQALYYIKSVGFKQAQNNAASADLGQKICAYADMRVGPHGVLTLNQRFADLQARYEEKYAGSKHVHDREAFEQALLKIEQDIQAVCRLDLQTITDDLLSGTIEALRNAEVAE